MRSEGRAWRALGAALLVATLSAGMAGWAGIVPPRLLAALSPMLIGLGLAGVALVIQGGHLASAWRAERARQERARQARRHRQPARRRQS